MTFNEKVRKEVTGEVRRALARGEDYRPVVNAVIQALSDCGISRADVNKAYEDLDI